jgi:hypothetical protein
MAALLRLIAYMIEAILMIMVQCTALNSAAACQPKRLYVHLTLSCFLSVASPGLVHNGSLPEGASSTPSILHS